VQRFVKRGGTGSRAGRRAKAVVKLMNSFPTGGVRAKAVKRIHGIVENEVGGEGKSSEEIS
jgi:hypothetical protein